MNPRIPFAMAAAIWLAACAATPAPAPTGGVDAVGSGAEPARDELIPRERLFGNAAYGRVRISPDGRYLSWIASLDGVANLWIAPVERPADARAVTRDTGRGIVFYHWSYRPDTVLYLQDSGGDEYYALHAVDVGTGQVRVLTPPAYVDDNVLQLDPQQPDQVAIGMNERDPRWQDIHRIDLASGERRLVEENTRQFSAIRLDARLRPRLGYQPLDDGDTDVWLRDDAGDWSVIDRIPFDDFGLTDYVAVAGNGRSAWLVESRERDIAGLYRVELGVGSRVLIHQDGHADLAPSDILAHPLTGEPQAARIEYMEPRWAVFDPAIAEDIAFLESALRGPQILARTLRDERWLIADNDPGASWDYYLFEPGTRVLVRLFSNRPALDGAPLVPMWPQIIPSRDGLDLPSYLTLPRHADPDADGVPDTAVPMVLLVHGGPWARNRFAFDSTVQWLANRGYAVLQVNYRGSTGFGKAFVKAADLEWGGKMHDDLVDAVGWAVERGITRQDSIAIMGASYGGYATLVGLTRTPDVFQCGVNIVGVSNLETFLASIPPHWTTIFEQVTPRIGDPRTDDGRSLLVERSPITHVDRIVRPLLIGHGSNDQRVKLAESEQIVAAMQARHIPVTYAVFPDEGHGFVRPENDLAFNAIAEAFLGECLGGRVEPIGDALTGSSITVPQGATLVPGLEQALSGHQPSLRP